MFEIFLTCKTISCLHSTGVLCLNNESLAAGSSPAQLVRPAKPSFVMDDFYFGTADKARGGLPSLSKLSGRPRSAVFELCQNMSAPGHFHPSDVGRDPEIWF